MKLNTSKIILAVIAGSILFTGCGEQPKVPYCKIGKLTKDKKHCTVMKNSISSVVKTVVKKNNGYSVVLSDIHGREILIITKEKINVGDRVNINLSTKPEYRVIKNEN